MGILVLRQYRSQLPEVHAANQTDGDWRSNSKVYACRHVQSEALAGSNCMLVLQSFDVGLASLRIAHGLRTVITGIDPRSLRRALHDSSLTLGSRHPRRVNRKLYPFS